MYLLHHLTEAVGGRSHHRHLPGPCRLCSPSFKQHTVEIEGGGLCPGLNSVIRELVSGPAQAQPKTKAEGMISRDEVMMLYAYGVKKVYGIKGGFKGRPLSELHCGGNNRTAGIAMQVACSCLVSGWLLQYEVVGPFSITNTLFRSHAWVPSVRCAEDTRAGRACLKHLRSLGFPTVFISLILTRLGLCWLVFNQVGRVSIASQNLSMFLKGVLLDPGRSWKPLSSRMLMHL